MKKLDAFWILVKIGFVFAILYFFYSACNLLTKDFFQ